MCGQFARSSAEEGGTEAGRWSCTSGARRTSEVCTLAAAFEIITAIVSSAAAAAIAATAGDAGTVPARRLPLRHYCTVVSAAVVVFTAGGNVTASVSTVGRLLSLQLQQILCLLQQVKS